MPVSSALDHSAAARPAAATPSVATPSVATPSAAAPHAAAQGSVPPAVAPTDENPPLHLGFQLPGYRVLRMFGQGGMGEVFLAERLSSTGVTVKCVVKTIREGVGDRDQFRSMFLDEARVVSHLRHPNVVSIIDVGQFEERLYLAMEWVDGVDADSLVKKSAKQGVSVPLRHILYLLREALQGLHYAHLATSNDGAPLGIIHRDISPGNILISRHGAVKLADFGVAVSAAAKTAGTADSLAGKPHYFSPELWRGAGASAQSDVFALGVTFYEILTGRPLFSRNKDIHGLAFEICEFDVERLIEDDLTLPEGLEFIVRRCLHQEPAQRYPSALAFLEDVNDYAYEMGIRLLDAHFAAYIERLLVEGDPTPGARKSIWKT